MTPEFEAELLKALRWAGDEFGAIRPTCRDLAARPWAPRGRPDYSGPIRPDGNRHERRKAAALARKADGSR